MLKLITASALCIAAAAACDAGAPSERSAPRSVKVTSEYIERLKGLSDLNRGLALRRAIQDAGNRCKKVDASAFQEDYMNLSLWTARCSDSGDWALFIAPNGDVQVRKCSDARQLGLPQCRIPAAG